MNEAAPEKKQIQLPFNNLYLNAGFVNGYNHWWMYLFGIIGAMFGYFLFQLIITFPLLARALSLGFSRTDIETDANMLFNPEKMQIDKNMLLALLLGMFVFALLFLYLVVKKLHKKTFTSIITAYEKMRLGRFFFAFAIWGSLILILTLVSYSLNPADVEIQFEPKKFFTLLVVSVFLMPIQTSTEEIIFRGYLVQGFSQITKNGLVPIIITSLLFGLMHMSNPEAKTYGWLTMLPYYTAFGLFLGILTLLDEGLELAMGIHCANNLISSLLITSPNGVLKTDAIFVAKSEDPGGEMLVWCIMAVVTFTIFWLKYRWKNFNLILK